MLNAQESGRNAQCSMLKSRRDAECSNLNVQGPRPGLKRGLRVADI
jgi:hypothetical protein